MMKTTFIKKLATLALSAFALGSFAQCPSLTGIGVSQTNSTAFVYAMLSNTVSPGTYFWNVSPTASVTGTPNSYNQTIYFPGPGSYSVCVNYIDSTTMCTSSTCTIVTVTSTTTPVCNALFSANTNSLCTTNFINNSTGTNLSYKWYKLPAFTLLSTQANPSLNLGNGNHQIALYLYSNNQYCDSMATTVSVNCTPPSTVCNAAFSYSVLPNCGVYFFSNSTGTNLTYEWRNMSTLPFPVISTQNTFSTTLAPGTNTIALYIYSNNQFCDSVTRLVTGCTATNTPCQVNSQFAVFADSTNAGNYFAYNQSTGNGTLSYLWNFGDGNTSTQQYPFHQYATPGQYIICLTTTSTNGSVTCSDMSCDSSSVQRVASGYFMKSLQVLAQTPTNIKEQQVLKSMNVYPNPVENELTIEVESEKEQTLNYVIVDALGKVVVKNELTASKTIINTTNLDKGIYFLSVSVNNTILKTAKLIK